MTRRNDRKFCRLITAVGLIFATGLLAATPTAAPPITDDALRKAFHESLRLEKLQNYAGAIQSLGALGAGGSRYYMVQLRLGWLYYQSGQHEESKKHYAAASQLKPACLEARLGYLQPLIAQGRFKEIEAVIEQLLQLDPKNYTVNLRLATTYRLQKKYGGAEQILTKMLRYYPCDAGALDEGLILPGHQPDTYIKTERQKFDLSNKYEKDQNLPDAIKAIESTIRNNANDYCANLRLGWLYYRTRDYAKSTRCCQICLQAVPESIEAKLAAALPLLALERYDQVIPLMQQVISFDPGNYLANLRLAVSLRLRKKYDEAESVAVSMLNRYPTDVSFLAELALTRVAQGHLPEARRLFLQINCLDPDNVTAKQFLERKAGS
jgi:tetratricopeptide (TPR) repeat protein